MLQRAGIALCLFFLMSAWMVYRIADLRSWDLPPSLIRQPVQIKARIISEPKVDALAAHFTAQLVELAGQSESVKINLSWYGKHPTLNLGDVWNWTVKLKPAHRLHNFGDFSEGIASLMSGVRATGYVDGRMTPHYLYRETWRYPVLLLRDNIKRNIEQSEKSREIGSLLTALSIGSRDTLSQQTWQVLRRTGTSHLIAISGLHVSFVGGLVYCLVSWFWRLFPSVLLRIPAPKAAACMALCSAVFYGFLAGFSLPTQRAVVMVAMLMLGHIFYRNLGISKRLAAAFLIVFMLQPLVLFTASFYLSFFAVAVIAFALAGRIRPLSKWREWSRMQYAVFIGLAPLTLYFFQQLSWVGLVANAVAIPWVGLLVVPVCFLASLLSLVIPSFGAVLFHLAAMLLTPLWYGLGYLSSFHGITWQHPLAEGWFLWGALAASFYCLLPRGWPGRFLGLLALLPLLFHPLAKPKPHDIWLTVMDVGQGLSLLVRTTHHTLLYDTGPHFYGGFNAGSAVLLPYFRREGIRSISLLMVSHGDNDHSGGAEAVLKSLSIKRFLTSLPRKFKSYSAKACYSGQHWSWDGVDFQVLWPLKRRAYDGNNSSCVLRITAGKSSLLLTGDIERPVERALLARGAPLEAKVLVAPHHGSSSSSSQGFVDAVSPAAVIFSDGYYNRYGHPGGRVVDRYKAKKADIFDTSRQGAISIHLSPDGTMSAHTARDEQAVWRW